MSNYLTSSKPNLFDQHLAKDLFWVASQFYETFGRGVIHIDLNDPKLLKIIDNYVEGKKDKQKLADNLSYIPLSLESLNVSGDSEVYALIKQLHETIIIHEEVKTYKPSTEGIGVVFCDDIPPEISQSHKGIIALVRITRFGVKTIKTIYQEKKED